ncbi:hypothetical protein HRbin02_01740 [Candidatus Calditenuaceae archaeon HR02]|nr:hypothetical protein HRbin02_01740 [Candidatus Calditenuaceae archaeon HR02]
MSTVVQVQGVERGRSVAERVAPDAPKTIKELINLLAEGEREVIVARGTPRDPVVFIKGRLVGAWLEL